MTERARRRVLAMMVGALVPGCLHLRVDEDCAPGKPEAAECLGAVPSDAGRDPERGDGRSQSDTSDDGSAQLAPATADGGSAESRDVAGHELSAAEAAADANADKAPLAGVDAVTDAVPGKPRRVKVLFDESHQPWPLTSKNWARFASDLVAEGHTVVTHTSGAVGPDVLASVGVLVIGTSWGEFHPAEITAMLEFVSDGGGLFMTGVGWSWIDPAKSRTIDNFPMNRVAEAFNIKFTDGVICDPASHDRQQCEPVFTTHGHPFADGLMKIGGGIAPCAVRPFTVLGEVVMRGSAQAMAKGHYMAGQHPPVLVAMPHGTGRVMALGHEAYLSTDDEDQDGVLNADEYDNRKLGLKIIQYLAGYQ